MCSGGNKKWKRKSKWNWLIEVQGTQPRNKLVWSDNNKAYGTGQLFRRAAIVRDRILAITDIWNSRPKSNLPPTEPAAVQESERRLRSSPCRRAARPSRGRAATVSQDCYLQPGCSFLHHHYSRLCPQTLMSRPSLQTWLPSLAVPAIAVMTERLPWSRLLLLSYLWLQADSEMPRHN